MGALMNTSGQTLGHVEPSVSTEQGVNESKSAGFTTGAVKTGASIGHRIRRGVGTVAKGAAVVTGVGVVGVMAGSTTLAVKSSQKKDEMCAAFGESLSYYLAKLLGGSDSMAVQRLQQAGMRGVDMAVQNKKAMNRAVRPLPTLNMPVAPSSEIEY